MIDPIIILNNLRERIKELEKGLYDGDNAYDKGYQAVYNEGYGESLCDAISEIDTMIQKLKEEDLGEENEATFKET